MEETIWDPEWKQGIVHLFCPCKPHILPRNPVQTFGVKSGGSGTALQGLNPRPALLISQRRGHARRGHPGRRAARYAFPPLARLRSLPRFLAEQTSGLQGSVFLWAVPTGWKPGLWGDCGRENSVGTVEQRGYSSPMCNFVLSCHGHRWAVWEQDLEMIHASKVARHPTWEEHYEIQHRTSCARVAASQGLTRWARWWRS